MLGSSFNLVCGATERSLLTTSTLLQQVKNKHLYTFSYLHNFRKIAANISLKPLQDRRSLLNIASPAARGGW